MKRIEELLRTTAAPGRKKGEGGGGEGELQESLSYLQ